LTMMDAAGSVGIGERVHRARSGKRLLHGGRRAVHVLGRARAQAVRSQKDGDLDHAGVT
jgi:hypothetical protein